MVPHSWSFYFLTKIGCGFIKWGTDPISYKIGVTDPTHFIGPVRRGMRIPFTNSQTVTSIFLASADTSEGSEALKERKEGYIYIYI